MYNVCISICRKYCVCVCVCVRVVPSPCLRSILSACLRVLSINSTICLSPSLTPSLTPCPSLSLLCVCRASSPHSPNSSCGTKVHKAMTRSDRVLTFSGPITPTLPVQKGSRVFLKSVLRSSLSLRPSCARKLGKYSAGMRGTCTR